MQIFFVRRLRGDAGETEIIAKLQEKALLVLFQVIKHQLHGLAKRAAARLPRKTMNFFWDAVSTITGL
jgi:hypothetical protein